MKEGNELIAPAEQPEAVSDEVRYIANHRMAVGVDSEGQKRFVEYGEEIPEAHTWKPMLRERYLLGGHISRVIVTSRGRGRPRKVTD